ncbi:Hypothetical_protein [Hexamita inflata]|uniref:Hypothetical_protein n=1 Tax=Hexamita inflata TaxID=28002 RepID=A0AA86P2T6_9EUKA|nr:Hypothetical protein HINF_LOCUS16807 [Hexamita inflata]
MASWGTPESTGSGFARQFRPPFALGKSRFTEPHTRFQVSGAFFPTGFCFRQEKNCFSRPGIFALGKKLFFHGRGRFGGGRACEKCKKGAFSWGGPLRRACLIFFALFHGGNIFDMRFQVWARDFRARKNLVGKSVSNCVSGGSCIIPGRKMFRIQGRLVRERASVQVERNHGEIIFVGAPLGLSRREAPAGRVCGAFCRVGSGRERGPEREQEREPEREREREQGGCSSSQKRAGELRTEALGETRPGEHARRPCWRVGRILPEKFCLAWEYFA